MAPAFSSRRQAGAFGLLLLVLLLLPALVGKSLLPPRGEIYSALSWRLGAFPFIDQQMSGDKRDIDIAFIGSSHIRYDVDTPYVQKALSNALGRPAVVVTLAWGWHGMDALYFITRDLLQNRKVHLIVINDDCGVNRPHQEAWRWFRFGEDEKELAGLSLRDHVYYYFGAMVGMPRNLLDFVRSNLPADLTPQHVAYVEQRDHYILPTRRLGSTAAQFGLPWRPDLFVHQVPPGDAQPSDAILYSPATGQKFDFSGPPAPHLQVYFAQKLAALVKARHSSLVLLLFPRYPEARDSVIHDSPLWPEGLGQDAGILGIPPAQLFSGLSDAQVRQLFADSSHFNQSGQEFYTPLITPSLLQLYESQVHF